VFTVLAIALGAGTVPAARAAEDAGVRSVFVHGNGNRAIALGGAFAAIADDASAPIWNPGGLGQIMRNSLYATHTDLIGMGFGEQFGSLVLPSWRYGVFALTMQTFGVDGIEHRDDRNVLLNSDLSDRETEITLGYGRQFGAAWNVGTAVKLQRQTLAGFSATGFGLDLGLLVRPLLAAGMTTASAQAWRVGVAFRNVVQPSLRLDAASVTDPTGIRLGTSWSHPLGALGDAVAALDVEKTQDMDARLHAGLELQFVRLLALRVGSFAGELTAGLGVRWSDLAFDYAYEDNPIEPVHRFGLKLDFGSSTVERRQAAHAAYEQELQQRLAHTFEAENRQQAERLIVAAQTELAATRFEEVRRLTAAARVIDPTRPELNELDAASWRRQAQQLAEEGDYAAAAVGFGHCLAIDPADSSAARGLASAREASDRQAERNAELRALFATALAAYTAENYPAARDGFAELLRRQPGDAEAGAMLRHTEQTMRLRGAALAEQARAVAAAGDWQEAEIILSRALALAPDDPAIARARAELEATRTKSTGSRSARHPAFTDTSAVSPSQLSPEQRSELDALYGLGVAAADAGRRDDAIQYWEMVWSIAPSYQNVRDNLKREYMVRGMEAFAAGELERAIRDWEQAVRIDPSDQRARGYLDRALAQQARVQQIPGEIQ
jgi:tetratricopeptide (TPR) repeat protein